jgi:hypothetical protein
MVVVIPETEYWNGYAPWIPQDHPISPTTSKTCKSHNSVNSPPNRMIPDALELRKTAFSNAYGTVGNVPETRDVRSIYNIAATAHTTLNKEVMQAG